MTTIQLQTDEAHERELLTAKRWSQLIAVVVFGAASLFAAGCDSSQTPTSSAQSAAKAAEPAVPAELQSAADAFLGKETTVLVFGDLAKTGSRQMLAANVVPKTPKNTLPGTIVTRAVLAEESGGSWHELLRCDEHLKNEKGYLGGSPIEPVAGWRVQFEQNDIEGFHLYLTPVKGNEDSHVLPLAVRWNPAVKRYQTLDRNYEHFLNEAASLGPARSHL
ncbi:MAG TPA: hypothetical protein VKP58_15265 [Candidatus Acidoferrum sp.]|nr:hypothetical protein [Candidatus Acidoferrum sp.]